VVSKLPLGQWIGGTTPCFMGDENGRTERELLHVSVMPGYAENVSLVTYDAVGLMVKGERIRVKVSAHALSPFSFSL